MSILFFLKKFEQKLQISRHITSLLQFLGISQVYYTSLVQCLLSFFRVFLYLCFAVFKAVNEVTSEHSQISRSGQISSNSFLIPLLIIFAMFLAGKQISSKTLINF